MNGLKFFNELIKDKDILTQMNIDYKMFIIMFILGVFFLKAPKEVSNALYKVIVGMVIFYKLLPTIIQKIQHFTFLAF